MGIEVYRNFFAELGQVLDDIKKDGFWPTTLVSRPSPALPTHWHDSEVHGYVVQGSAWVLDGESGERVDMRQGDKLVIPAGALHAEGETDKTMIYIVALPEARPFDEFLRMQDPEDPKRPGG